MSKVVMRLKFQWWLFVLPVASMLGFYLFMVGANYYYAGRAAYLLKRIRDLKLDNSVAAELKQIGSEHGFRYEEEKNCGQTSCMHFVSPNNQWMWSLLRPPILSKIGEHAGLRRWLAVGDIEIENGQVIAKIYGLELYPKTEVTAWHERKLELDPCMYYPLKRHPGYGSRNASNVRNFRVLVSDVASKENQERAFQFNLSCLTRWNRCERFSEMMPEAWADYEEDGRWSDTHPDNLVRQLGTKCPY